MGIIISVIIIITTIGIAMGTIVTAEKVETAMVRIKTTEILVWG